METRISLPNNDPPQTISSIVAKLKAVKLQPTHDKKSWGDWITFSDNKVVISIESIRGLTTSATLELEETEEDENPDWEAQRKILQVFAKLGWQGEDEDGPYPL